MRLLPTTFAGVLLMLTATDPVPGQEKKDDGLKAPYDQFVKVEGKDRNGKAFTLDQVPAYRPATKAPIWRVSRAKIEPGGKEWKDVAVTDKDNKKYGIEKITEGSGYLQLWIKAEPQP